MLDTDWAKIPDAQAYYHVQPYREIGHAVRKRGVLVVDDTPAIGRMLETALRSCGFAVWNAESGLEAVEVFQSHRDRIDLILMDVRMPGLDGPQTLGAIQRVSPGILCCFMSGDLGIYTEEGLLQMGARSVFQKPFRIADVSRAVERFIREQNVEPSASIDKVLLMVNG